MLILALVLKDSLRTYFKSLSLSWSLGQILVLVADPCPCPWGQILVLALVLVLGGQVLVNILARDRFGFLLAT